MRLSKLILNGFKSFADRTEFTFDDDITGVVGPNGCGKSNVVDAIKWVLGERSSKSLRGKEMIDVIFAGAAGRSPAGMASVTLGFDNPIIDADAELVELTLNDPLDEDEGEEETEERREQRRSGRRRRGLPIEADEVFLTGSAAEMIAVTGIISQDPAGHDIEHVIGADKSVKAEGPITKELRTKFREIVTSDSVPED